MWDPENYTIAAKFFPRLLGVIYFFAFGAFIFQIKGLLGVNGILPIQTYLKRIKRYQPYPLKRICLIPTLFWLEDSDAMLMGVVCTGTFLSVLLVFGIAPPLLLFLLYILYLSIVNSGQDFLGYGWEGLLLETTLQAILLSLTTVPNMMVWLSTSALIFRFHVQAGAVKLISCDASWRNLTAVACHYQTQPLPNTIAWFAHKLPLWFQKASAVIMFALEMVLPFGIFFNEYIRLVVFFGLFGLQWLIWFTGNFSFLNYLTAVMVTVLVSNTFLNWLSTPPEALVSPPLWLDFTLTFLGSLLLLLQLLRLWHQHFPNKNLETILHWCGLYHIANRYGIFAVMTTHRYEIVLEGSEDGSTWKEYFFRYKPSEVTRRPRRIAPYQPRLDWQAWFLPFSNFDQEIWFQNFCYHLLKGTPEVLTLLRSSPFQDKPPKFVRALAYEYTFSNFQQLREKGVWWNRQLIGHFSPTLSLKD